MQFELTREFVEQIKDLIQSENSQEIKGLIGDLHPADIAETMDELSLEEAKYIYLMLDGETASDTLVEIPEQDRKKLLKILPVELLASKFIEFMDSDDAADIVGELDEEVQQEVLNEIEDIEQAGDIVDLLEYDEESAGGIMAKELVSVNENLSVQGCLKEISEQSENVDEIYYVYVVDDTGVLKGILSLKKLILAKTNMEISSLYDTDIKSVTTEAPQEEVANKMEKYDLVAIPVVDSIGRLKGRITIDDVIDIIREEAEKDYQMVSGITGDVESSDKVWELTRARIPWLFIGLLGGILGAIVIGNNGETLKELPQMVLFIPLIAAMAGNVGVQSSSIVVQSIASGARDIESISQKLLKEFAIALITAFVFTVLIFIFILFYNGDMILTWAVAVSLFIVIVFASLFGTMIPLLLNKLKIDPALATGPFITTMNDIMGLFIYLIIGNIFFNFF